MYLSAINGCRSWDDFLILDWKLNIWNFPVLIFFFSFIYYWCVVLLILPVVYFTCPLTSVILMIWWTLKSCFFSQSSLPDSIHLNSQQQVIISTGDVASTAESSDQESMSLQLSSSTTPSEQGQFLWSVLLFVCWCFLWAITLKVVHIECWLNLTWCSIVLLVRKENV